MTPQIFGYIICSVAVVAFLVILFRSKADIDYMQDELPSGKKTNSLLRLAFILMIGFAIFYCGYQMVGGKSIDIVFVLEWIGVAFTGKVGQKYLEAVNKDNTPPTP